MPDFSKPPLHALAHDKLLAKLRSLTNLGAVRDPSSEGGWKVEVSSFPGWKVAPSWWSAQRLFGSRLTGREIDL